MGQQITVLYSECNKVFRDDEQQLSHSKQRGCSTVKAAASIEIILADFQCVSQLTNPSLAPTS